MTSFPFVPEAEVRERAQHATHTVYRRLIELGHTAEEIAEVAAEGGAGVDLRGIGLTFMPQDGAKDPVVGVAYGGDYRAEEEHGLAELSAHLGRASGQKDIIRAGDGSAWWALKAPGHADDRDLDRAVADAEARADNPWYPERVKDSRLTLADMRTALKERGVTPLPTTKTAAFPVYRRLVRGIPERESVGEFHNGTWLVLMPGSGPAGTVIRDALGLIMEAAEVDSLRLGGSTNPFGRSMALFDERDLTSETVSAVRAAENYRREQLQAAADVLAALRSRGYLWAVKPARIAPGGRRLGDYFYINYSPRNGKQLSAWMTLEELRELADHE